VVAQRLAQYRKLTLPLIQYYTDKGILQTFSGTLSNVIYKDVEQFLTGLGLKEDLPQQQETGAAAAAR